jgi:hypothetical protein
LALAGAEALELVDGWVAPLFEQPLNAIAMRIALKTAAAGFLLFTISSSFFGQV